MKLIPKINVNKAAGQLAGGVAAKVVSSRFLASQSNLVKNGGLAVAGLILSGRKNSMISGAGEGMFITAGVDLVQGLFPAIGSDPMLQEDVLLGNNDFSSFASDQIDTTSAGAGEMNH